MSDVMTRAGAVAYIAAALAVTRSNAEKLCMSIPARATVDGAPSYRRTDVEAAAVEHRAQRLPELEQEILYPVPVAARLMGISETTLWTLIRGREIDSIAIPSASGRGKRSMRRIERKVIDKFINKHRQEAAS